MSDPRHLLGRRGEQAVATWLTGRGWTVLAARWRCPAGELDLVCRDPGGALVGVEVKVRRNRRAGSGAEALTARSLRRLRATLGAFARARPFVHGNARIDLVEVNREEGGVWRLRRVPVADAW